MHRCLLSYEIVVQIAWQSRVQQDEKQGLRDIAAVARTCSALYEPAMDVLWHTLYSLAPLVKCLPPDLWYEERRAEEPPSNHFRTTLVSIFCQHIHSKRLYDSDILTFALICQYLVRRPTDSDWDKTLRNAARVRSLISRHQRPPRDETKVWGQESLSFEVIHALGTYCASRGWHTDASQSYLPNLYSLQWGSELKWFDVDTLSFTFVPYLVSDKLKIFGLSGSGPDFPQRSSSIIRTVRHALNSLFTRCSSLEELYLDLSGDVWNKVYEEVPGNLSRLPHLRVLHISDWAISFRHFGDLSQHLSLQDVSLFMKSFKDAQWQLAFEPRSLFLTLHTLSVQAPDVTSCTKLLGTIGSSSLSSLQISCEPCDGTAAASQIELLLHEATHYRHSLQTLDLDVYFTLRKPEPGPFIVIPRSLPTRCDPEIIISSRSLGLILSLHGLSYLKLHFGPLLSLNDEFIQALAEACPRLTVLLLASTGPHTLWCKQPDITLLGLLPLIKHCLELRTLEISVDMVPPSVDILQSALARANPDHGLQVFVPPYGHGLTEENLETVAEAILSLFPGLRYFKITSDLPSPSRELGRSLRTKVYNLINSSARMPRT